MDLTAKQMAEEIKKYDQFVVVYHIRPDGDCIGSSYALGLALQALGKKCVVKGQDDVPPDHHFMTDQVTWDEVTDPVWISVDTATQERTGTFSDRHYKFCIDHHRNNNVDAEFKYIEEDCGACAEIIFKVIKAFGIKITKQIADFLYTGLVMDTMCFRTTDTNAQSFMTAAELAELGADIYGLGRRHMFTKKPGRIKIEKYLQDSLHFINDGQIVTGVITQEELKKAGILLTELESINSFVEQIEGVKIGITIRELENGTSRCSVRTTGTLAADLMCKVYGGGGHLNAAGCVLDCPPEEARKKLEETAAKLLSGELNL